MIRVVTVETRGLGDRSYLVSDGRAAVAVDPQRDLDRLFAALDRLGAPLTHVLETHLHNDYVTGGLELARRTGAAYAVTAGEDVAYERVPVADGDLLRAGGMQIRVLSTPGHTPTHVSYAVRDTDGPGFVFTGGSLLYGAVGRTDLCGQERTLELARAQFRSARRLLDELPDAMAVLPTHGFGSFCTSSSSAPPRFSGTVGEERHANPAALAGHEDEFVRALVGGLTAYPRYYAHMAAVNRAGPAPLDLAPAPPVAAEELGQRIEEGGWAVDLRRRRAFAARHLAGTVNVELGEGFATYLGWVLPWGTPVTLLGDTEEEVAQAQRALARIGIDHPAGRATGGIDGYGAAGAERGYPVAGFRALAAARGDPDLAVLDVRRDDEWAEGHVAGAVHVPLPDLESHLADLPDAELWVHCGSGFRASIGASLLARAGRRVVLLDDEFDEAARAGLPIV